MDLLTIAHTACSEHGASQDAEELAGALDAVRAACARGAGVVVEIGCDRGGSLWAWNQVATYTYGITLEDNSYAVGGSGGLLTYREDKVLIGDSHDPQSRIWLAGELNGYRIDALIIDGDHTEDGVRADIGDYGPLVRPGGVILLHDVVSTDPRVQVQRVWDEFRARFVASYEIGDHYGWGVVIVPSFDMPPPADEEPLDGAS